MVDWYYGKVFVDYVSNQVVLEFSVNYNVIGYDCIVVSFYVFDFVVFNNQ